MKSFTVSLPCKTYIRKYFCGLYGEIIVLDNRSDFGDTIITKISAKPFKAKSDKILGLSARHYDDTLKFQISMDSFYRIESNLSDQHYYFVNRFLENTFTSDMFTIIRIANCFGVEKITAIKAFCEKYNIIIDEDISLEGLKKSYYRFEKKGKAKTFFLSQMSSPFSGLNLRA